MRMSLLTPVCDVLSPDLVVASDGVSVILIVLAGVALLLLLRLAWRRLRGGRPS